MIIYNTKYALTSGILKHEGEVYEKEDYAKVSFPGSPNGWDLVHKPYFHLTEEAAKTHAEELRRKKVIALKKQIAKLETLTIQIKEIS